MFFSLADFTLIRAVCELRHPEAYLLFDNTGAIFDDLRDSFTDLTVISAAPNSTTFNSDEGNFVVELGLFRFIEERPDSSLEIFSKHIAALYSIVTERLKIDLFSRIGLRVTHQKNYKELSEAIDTLNKIEILKNPVSRFGIGDKLSSVELRWEGKELGATTRILAQSAQMEVKIPGELQDDKKKLTKKVNALTVDVDYYTVTPVARSQWDATSWIPQSMRIIKREVDKLIES